MDVVVRIFADSFLSLTAESYIKDAVSNRRDDDKNDNAENGMDSSFNSDYSRCEYRFSLHILLLISAYLSADCCCQLLLFTALTLLKRVWQLYFNFLLKVMLRYVDVNHTS